MSEKNQFIIIIGGDERMETVKKKLDFMGCSSLYIKTITKDMSKIIESADIVVLPVPVTRDGKNVFSSDGSFILPLKDVAEAVKEGCIVSGGNIPQSLHKSLSYKNVRCYDLLKNEKLVIYNAYLTAQGALRLLLNHTSSFISDKNILVTGFGRVSRALCSLLVGVGIRPYVAARNEAQLCEAECLGYKSVDIGLLSGRLDTFDYIFNTVPEQIFTAEHIKELRCDCIYFELASKPYGAKKEDFLNEKKNYIPAPALPGRFTPDSAAEIIAEHIFKLIKGGENNE